MSTNLEDQAWLRMYDLKRLLRDEENDPDIQHLLTPHVEAIPILHNEDKVILQLWGWAIELNSDGTWWLDCDTSGG